MKFPENIHSASIVSFLLQSDQIPTSLTCLLGLLKVLAFSQTDWFNFSDRMVQNKLPASSHSPTKIRHDVDFSIHVLYTTNFHCFSFAKDTKTLLVSSGQIPR
jgi:hypothetical protein